MKTAKKYIIICYWRDEQGIEPISESRRYWQHEPGNKRINRKLKTIKSLISNLKCSSCSE